MLLSQWDVPKAESSASGSVCGVTRTVRAVAQLLVLNVRLPCTPEVPGSMSTAAALTALRDTETGCVGAMLSRRV